MAIPTILVGPSGDRSIDGLLWGWKWGENLLTYRFPQDPNEYLPQFPSGPGYRAVHDFVPFSAFQANQIVNFGLNNLSVFSGLKFAPDSNYGGGNLRFGQAGAIQYEAGHGNPDLHIPGGIGSAEGNPPDPFFSSPSAQGDTWYSLGNYTNPVLGSFQYAAGLLHEVGHALGLKHGHHRQDRLDGTQDPLTLPTLPRDEDSQEYSVMTYRAYVGRLTPASGQEEYPWTYMVNDVAALQYLYGANFGPGSNEGNTRYSFNGKTGEMTIDGFGFGGSYHAKILLTIWDGGGRDTYDFSNYKADQSVDLGPGGWSTFSPRQLANLSFGRDGIPPKLARGNLANALLYRDDPRSLIENAIAGEGDDRVSGNSGTNMLDGGGGKDALFGLKGADRLLGGAGADRLIAGAGRDVLRGEGGPDRLNGGDGPDVLSGGAGADTFVFADGAGGADAWDRIVDFSKRQGDEIDLSGFDGNSEKAGRQGLDFVGTDRGFSDDPGEVRFRSGPGFLEINMDGDRQSEFRIELAGVGAFGADSLVL